MGFDSLPLQEQRSLQSDGIPSQEISSASNIMAISSLPRNQNCLPSIASARISRGMMLYIIGKNASPHLWVTIPSLNTSPPPPIVSYSLLITFIEPSLRRAKKSRRPQGFWNDPNNRRKFLEDYAREKGFDPLVPENWKNQTGMDLRRYKVHIHPHTMKNNKYLSL